MQRETERDRERAREKERAIEIERTHNEALSCKCYCSCISTGTAAYRTILPQLVTHVRLFPGIPSRATFTSFWRILHLTSRYDSVAFPRQSEGESLSKRQPKGKSFLVQGPTQTFCYESKSKYYDAIVFDIGICLIFLMFFAGYSYKGRISS